MTTYCNEDYRELLLLSMTVSMGMLIFAGLGYALEKDEEDTEFYTLPQTLYWAIITMTSTGAVGEPGGQGWEPAGCYPIFGFLTPDRSPLYLKTA